MKTVTIKNSQLQKMFVALTVLKHRRMANLGADLKVARMVRLLAPIAEPIGSLKNDRALELYRKEVPEGSNLTPLQEQVVALAIAEAQKAVDETEVTIDLPVEFALCQADLPKGESGPDGWKNGAELGALVGDLGDLYILDEEPS